MSSDTTEKQTNEQAAPKGCPPRLQFSLRALLGVVWCICVILGTLRYGLVPPVALGVPLAITGFLFLTGKGFPGGRRWLLAVPAVLVSVSLLVGCLLLATPLDAATWMIVCGAVAWAFVLSWHVGGRKRCLVAAPLVFQWFVVLYILAPRDVEAFVPLDGTYIQDVRGGRDGMQFAGIRVGWSGPNTDLLEHCLGPLQPEWRHRCCLSPYIKDGNERVNSRSIIGSDFLPELLAMLPHDEARRQVLTCLTDSGNLARVHQGLLLTCLYTLGYPPGHDASSWWEHHAPLFQSKDDPDAAVRLVWAWCERAASYDSGKDGDWSNRDSWEIQRQLRAARYQETGSWGGDFDFGDSYQLFLVQNNLLGGRNTKPPIPDLGVDKVIWWPVEAVGDETVRGPDG